MKKLVLSLVVTSLTYLCMSSSASAQNGGLWNNFEGTEITAWGTTGLGGFDQTGNTSYAGTGNGWTTGNTGWNAIWIRPNIYAKSFRPASYRCDASAMIRSSGNVSGFFFSALQTEGEWSPIVAELGPLAGSQLATTYQPLQFSFNWTNSSGANANPGLRLGYWGNGAGAWVQIDNVMIFCRLR